MPYPKWEHPDFGRTTHIYTSHSSKQVILIAIHKLNSVYYWRSVDNLSLTRLQPKKLYKTKIQIRVARKWTEKRNNMAETYGIHIIVIDKYVSYNSFFIVIYCKFLHQSSNILFRCIVINTFTSCSMKECTRRLLPL